MGGAYAGDAAAAGVAIAGCAGYADEWLAVPLCPQRWTRLCAELRKETARNAPCAAALAF